MFPPQAEEHPLHLQHRPGCALLARLHRPIPDGQEHLVLCGEPLLQVPLLLQSILQHEIRIQATGGWWVGGRINEETLAVDDDRFLSSRPSLSVAARFAWRIRWTQDTDRTTGGHSHLNVDL